MQRRLVSEGVRIARANVRLATQLCGAADMRGIGRALELLDDAAGELRRAEAEARSRTPEDAGELHRETVLLKREVAIMLRAVDGCAAMWRGLSMRLGSAAPGYTPQGRVASAPPSPEACELLG